jgi:hypothetical protein
MHALLNKLENITQEYESESSEINQVQSGYQNQPESVSGNDIIKG